MLVIFVEHFVHAMSYATTKREDQSMRPLLFVTANTVSFL